MTKEEFKELTRNPVLLDGAVGSNMLAAGMPRGICTEKWLTEHIDLLQRLQTEYLDAGAQILYAPTFGANRISLNSHGLGDEVKEINQTLVRAAKEITEGRAYVAGDVTTTGKILGFDDDYEYTDAYDNYCEQISLQVEAGADLIVIETMISFTETTAAIDACSSVCDLPVMVTLSVSADGGIFYGGNAIRLASDLEAAGIDAVGINCSVGPSQLDSVVRNIASAVDIPVIAKPNAGLPTIDMEGHAHYDLTPEAFAEQTMVLYENGAQILGGCCGTRPDHLRALNELLRAGGTGSERSRKMQDTHLKIRGKGQLR